MSNGAFRLKEEVALEIDSPKRDVNTYPRATHRLGCLKLLGVLDLKNQACSYRVSLVAIQFYTRLTWFIKYTCSVASRMCFSSHIRKGEKL